MVDLLTDRLAVPLGEGSRPAAANVVHYALGVVPGALYAGVRSSVPAISAGRGLLFGVLLWAVNDEFLNTRLRLAGPPAAYPLTTHVRGLVGHAVLGMGTELGIAILSGMARLGRRRRVA